MTLLGELSLWVALVMAAWGTTVSFAGGALRNRALISSGERAVYATCALVGVASLGLVSALLRADVSLAYVARYTSANLPTPYKITAFWAGQSGQLLFWTLMLACSAAVAVWLDRRRLSALAPFVAGTLSAITLCFLLVAAFGANPYERLTMLPPDGRGMHPQLQHPGMALHPPMLHLGYAASAVPFALAVAALVTRRPDVEWLGTLRRWGLLSWCVLTIGILLGMWWRYVELGWRGDGAWAPLESASLLPWSTATAFLHASLVQEKRGMLRRWNLTLVLATFLLAVFGAFVTGGGLVSSVDSAAHPAVRDWFVAFLVLGIAVSAWLVIARRGEGGATARIESAVSREAAFLLNNLLLVAVALAVLWGMIFPLLGEAERVAAPFALGLLALTAIGPLVAWRRASWADLRRQLIGPVIAAILAGGLLVGLGMRDVNALLAYVLAAFVAGAVVREFVKGARARQALYGEGTVVAVRHLIARHGRRYGGYVVHLGIVVLVAGLTGLAFTKEFEVSILPGETYTATDPFGRDWAFTSNGVSRFQQLNRQVTAIALQAGRAGTAPSLVTSARRQHLDSRGVPIFEPSTEIGIVDTWRQDVSVVLREVGAGERAELRITFTPLVRWVWLGGAIMVLGGLVVMWPRAERGRWSAEVAWRHVREPLAQAAPVEASPDELARVEAALRRGD